MLAEDQVNLVSAIVAGKLQTVLNWANTAREAADATIAAIGKFPVPVVNMNLPAAPVLGGTVSPGVNDPPNTKVEISPVSVSYDETGQVLWQTPAPLPDMIYGEAVAPLPAPTDQVATPPTLYPQVPIPVVPPQPELVSPTEPTLANASPPALLYVDVPEYTFPVLPSFDQVVPLYAVPAPIAPVAPVITYPSVVNEDLKNRILGLLSGTTGGLDETREAMIDKLVESADMEAQAAIDKAFDGAAARNFSLPYGVLVDGVNDIRYAAGQKIRDGMSAINNKLAEEALKNYQAGMDLALVLEKAYISLYLEYTRQVLEAEKLNAQIAVELFNATVALFNAQQSARQIHFGAHRAHVMGIVSGMGAYPIAIEGAIAETAENEQRIQMYAADGRLVKARSDVYASTTRKELVPIELYKAEVAGVKVQSDIIVANVDAYRAAVTAYATGVGATVEVINAFANETQAKTSQTAVYNSNAKAYAAYVQEGAKRANTWKVFASAQGDVLRANIQTYQTAADANRSFVQAQAAAISAEAEIATARASAYSTGVRAVGTYNRATMDNAATAQQYAMVAAENVARAQSLAAIAKAETDRINAGALAAQTTALSGLAQGAMSALHVSASAEGDGGVSANAQWQEGTDELWGGNNSWNESKTEQLSA